MSSHSLELISVNLSQLMEMVMKLSRIERVPTYSDDKHETDTEHSFALALAGGLLAIQYRPELDVAKVVMLGLVHDFVELYAGDTPSLNLSKSAYASKQSREQAACNQLRNKLAETWPAIIGLIEEYEAASSVEAEFVAGLDKTMPSLVHISNNAKVMRDFYGLKSWDDVTRAKKNVTSRLRESGVNDEFVLSLREATYERLRKCF